MQAVTTDDVNGTFHKLKNAFKEIFTNYDSNQKLEASDSIEKIAGNDQEYSR